MDGVICGSGKMVNPRAFVIRVAEGSQLVKERELENGSEQASLVWSYSCP